MDKQMSLAISYQPLVNRLLNNALKSGHLHSAYIFTGNEGYGKWNAAVLFAGEILSTHWKTEQERKTSIHKVRKLIHPDLHLLFPMPSPKKSSEDAELVGFFRQTKTDNPFAPVEYGRAANILVDKVRQLKKTLYSTASEGGYRVAIFQQIERMPRTSFDILLKTIEEPPPETVLILLTDNIRRLPATVVSRCQKVRFTPVAKSFIEQYLTDKKGLTQEDAAHFARLSGGSFTEAYRLSHGDFSNRREPAMNLLSVIATGSKAQSFVELNQTVDMRNRDEAIAIIKLWQSFLRDTLILKENIPDSYLDNADYKYELEKISAGLGNRDIICQSMMEVLEAQKLFYRNLPPRLALTGLAWRLRDFSLNNR